MRYGWLFIFPIFALVGVVILAWYRYRRMQRTKKNKCAKRPSITHIAHTKKIRELPEYKKAMRQYYALIGIALILFGATTTSLTVLSSRPISVTEQRASTENRDIMLCLDVSGSMNEYVTSIAKYFAKLTSKLNGERIGITIFDGVYATISPLTDDYTSLNEIFDNLENNLDDYTFALYSSINFGSSNIGPGLVGCTEAFDRLADAERSRSIILATDNLANRDQAISLLEAGAYAKTHDITIYGIYAGSDSCAHSNASYCADYNEFLQTTTLTNGALYAPSFETYIGSNTEIESFIEDVSKKILDQEAARYEGAKQLVRNDVPELAAIISAISLLAFIFIIWRLRL